MFSAMSPSTLGQRCGEEEFKNGNHMVLILFSKLSILLD